MVASLGVSQWIGELVRELLELSCEKLVAEVPDSSGTSAVESRYRATATEDCRYSDLCSVQLSETVAIICSSVSVQQLHL
jgi:hypothetical protein